MTDLNERILEQTEKKISQKGQDEYFQRIIIKERDLNQYKVVCEILKKKIKKKMLPVVIERMKWAKFGIVKGQQRGILEPGIVVLSNEEIHIIDRKNDIEQDLGDKLRENINNRKMIVLKEMKEKRERENREKLSAFGETNQRRQINNRRNREGTIKITGFKPTYTAEKLVSIFEKIGPIKRCNVPSKNVAFINFDQTLHAQEAFEKFNDATIDGCVLTIQVLTNNN